MCKFEYFSCLSDTISGFAPTVRFLNAAKAKPREKLFYMSALLGVMNPSDHYTSFILS